MQIHAIFFFSLTKHLQCKHSLLCMNFKGGREAEKGSEVGKEAPFEERLVGYI